MALTVRSFLRAKGNNWLENVFEWKGIITKLFSDYIMGCFIGLCLTVSSKMNSNMIVDKLWNGSNALQISRNGLDCQTDGLMIYERPINAPVKYDIQEVFSWVTKKLQYANESDSVYLGLFQRAQFGIAFSNRNIVVLFIFD